MSRAYSWMGAVVGGVIGYVLYPFILFDYKVIVYLNFIAFGLIVGLVIGIYSKWLGGSIGGALILGLVESYLNAEAKQCSWLTGGCSNISGLYGFFGSMIGGAVAGFCFTYDEEERQKNPSNEMTMRIMFGGAGVGTAVGFIFMVASKLMIGISTLIPFSVPILLVFGYVIGKPIGTWAENKWHKRQRLAEEQRRKEEARLEAERREQEHRELMRRRAEEERLRREEEERRRLEGMKREILDKIDEVTKNE